MMNVAKIKALMVGFHNQISQNMQSLLKTILVRHKVKELIDFVQDEYRLREERKRARANRDKYIGLSNESPMYRSRKFSYMKFSRLLLQIE